MEADKTNAASWKCCANSFAVCRRGIDHLHPSYVPLPSHYRPILLVNGHEQPQLQAFHIEAQLLQLRRLELRRLEAQHSNEQRCALLQARCRSLEKDLVHCQRMELFVQHNGIQLGAKGLHMDCTLLHQLLGRVLNDSASSSKQLPCLKGQCSMRFCCEHGWEHG